MARSGTNTGKSDKANTPDPRLVKRGERVAAVRERAGYANKNQAATAIADFVDQATLGGVEAGTKDINVTTAERIADGYGVSMDVLLGRAPIPEVLAGFVAKQPIVDSAEFKAAPEIVQQRFLSTKPSGAKTWSTVAWARAWFKLWDYWSEWKKLPPEPAEESLERVK
jgi:hypothetical protein